MWGYNLRVFAVFAVILLHVSSGFVNGVSDISPFYSSNDWWAGNVFNSISRWCVPAFVIISGYFLLCQNEDNRIFFTKRVKKIFIPLIFWSIFFSLWILVKSFIKGDLTAGCEIIIKGWMQGAPYYHLWYLFMIPFLYAITPFLRAILNCLSQKIILFFIIFSFSLAALNVFTNYLFAHFEGGQIKPTLFFDKFLLYIGYFMLGGYINKFKINVNTWLCIAILGVSLCITILCYYHFFNDYFYSYLSINVIFISISVFFLIKNTCNKNFKLNLAAQLTFGIYLIHPLFLDIINITLKNMLLNVMNGYFYILFISIIVFILSYSTSFIMSKIKYISKCI